MTVLTGVIAMLVVSVVTVVIKILLRYHYNKLTVLILNVIFGKRAISTNSDHGDSSNSINSNVEM